MEIKELFYNLNNKKITKDEFSNKLFNHYKDKNIRLTDIRDNLINYVDEDLDSTLSEIEEELFNDRKWSIFVNVGNENDDEGYEDCYLYIYFDVIDKETISITKIDLI